MKKSIIEIKPGIVPRLDPGFIPAALAGRNYVKEVKASGKGEPLAIALERSDGLVSVYNTKVFGEGSGYEEDSCFYVERIVKSLLWVYGGWKVIIGGPEYIGKYIDSVYKPGGLREFDYNFMSRVYEKPFTVVITEYGKVPPAKSCAVPVGRHLDGSE